MKPYKLIVHNKDFSEEDLVLNPKDFPEVRLKDVIELYQPDCKFSRLLLKVTSLRDDFQQKDTISVDQNIASNFHLRTFADVLVNIVDPKAVALDSLELTFKDQYLERGDMWRLRRNLETTCVYLNKKIEFCGIRCQVYEMWAQGERVACGVIADNTKIVFRSSTSLVYLFIQMSSEMWDVDINGDLYFEKAINGFLADLFAKWKENACSHEVTIVLFSRTFYESQNQEEFPPSMRACIEQDYRGRFYEDFYSVAVQNERYEDWAVILVVLKRLFNNYRESVLRCHHRPGVNVPRAINSTAAQGNFLEVLNMSLNVFEKHYLDRSFDRTGHLSVVITPGVGVFEVDRELTNLTKQRIIDNGVGSDLVCLGEQPLHAVPLFKFHSKSQSSSVDDYSMPHWINLSFYSSSKQASYSTFIPRIKVPPRKTKPPRERAKNSDIIQPRTKPVEQDFPPLMDYDEYDAQVFKHAVPGTNNARQSNSLQRALQHHKKSEVAQLHHSQPRVVPRVKKFSESDLGFMQSSDSASKLMSRSAAITIPQKNMDLSPLSSSLNILSPDGGRLTPSSTVESCDDEVSSPVRPIVGSAGSPYAFPIVGFNAVRPGRALINPFDPSHVTIKLTSNRRRWTHVFPLGPTGIFMQQHHYQAVPHGSSHTEDMDVGEPSLDGDHSTEGPEPRRRKTSSISIYPHLEASYRSKGTPSRNSVHTPHRQSEKSLTLLWGATGEQEWTPALTTGVDWKSLTIPACLPLTTDYFPDRRSLNNDYVFSGYDLIPEYMVCDTTRNRNSSYKPLTTVEVFQELVCQRLVQGFQLIVNPRTNKFEMGLPVHKQSSGNAGSQSLRRGPLVADDEHKEEYFLSIGRIFHRLTLTGGTIKATCLKPRHLYPTIKIDYRYRFKAPYSDSYEVSWVEFTSEKLENFNWNYLDHYICTHGENDFSLSESMKYMRFRMFLLPVRAQGTKLISEAGDGARCDVYEELSAEEDAQLTDGFIKFLEVLNKIRRSGVARKPRERSGTLSKLTPGPRRPSQTSQPIAVPVHVPGAGAALLPFRDRIDNRSAGAERPRAPTASKVIERVRSESGNGGRGVLCAQTSLGGESKTISSSSMSLDSGTDSMTVIQKEGGGEDGTSPVTTPRRLTLSSSLQDIVEAMKHPQDGLNFVSNTTSLPNMTFVGAEATAWMMEHLEGSSDLDKAIRVLENLRQNDFICHCSGDPLHPFHHGFYLYHICPSDKELHSDGYSYSSLGDVEQFQKEWLEVTFHRHRCRTAGGVPLQAKPAFLRPELKLPCDGESEQIVHRAGSKASSTKYNIPLFKNTNVDIASGTKSNREEWGHVRYHGHYNPAEAFEVILQWLVATGSIVTELVHQNLARRATAFGFALLPLPGDPFALPFSYQSDPLRGPIFIPLAVECLSEDGTANLFWVFPRSTREYRMFLFQEAIAKRFGFVATRANRFLVEASSPDTHPGGGGGGSQPLLGHQHQPHYVHTTGNMFLMALIQLQQILTQKTQKDFAAANKTVQSGLENIVSSPHEEYITRHIMGRYRRKSLHLDEQDCRIGYLWSFNYMLSKRWKLGITGDESFMFKILNDFRCFCANKDNRLKAFWDSAWAELNEFEANKQEI